jgi:hypothetical protein
MMKLRHAKIGSKKGSALIITLLMITVIASVSFAVTALALSEFRKAANIQDSIVAYYAAESGLEHGLMEYRLWHDAEISSEVYEHAQGASSSLILPQNKIPTETEGTPQTFRLTGAKPGETQPGYVSPVTDKKGNSWYDLKMFYRGDKIGEVDASGNPVVDDEKSPRVKRDSAAEYSLNGAKGLHIAWRPDPQTLNSPPPILESSDASYFLELTYTVADGSLCPQPRHDILKVTANSGQSSMIPGVLSLTDCKYESVRIKPWNMKYAQYSLVLLDQNAPTGNPIKVDQLRTTFLSTGYSGTAKRTLELDISRTIGTIIESGDFLFLSGDKPLQF